MSYIKVPTKRGFNKIEFIYDKWSKKAHFAGGYARYAASPLDIPAEPDDIDIWVKEDNNSYQEMKENLLSWGAKIKTDTDVAETFTMPGIGVLRHTPKVQLIKPKSELKGHQSGKLEDVLDSFDFTIAKAAIISQDECLVHEDFLKDEENKVLNIKSIQCPVSAVFRIIKYAKRGYSIPTNELLKLFQEWEHMPSDRKVKLLEYLVNFNTLAKQDKMDFYKMVRIMD